MGAASKSTSMEYVPSAPESSKVPIAPMGFSHVLRLVLAGRRCLCPEWLGELLIVHHHGQHSLLCACSRSEVPIAPMGDSHFARCLQGGGVFVQGGSVTFDSCTITGNTATYVRAHPQNFPSPPWETHVLLVFTGRRCLCLFRHRHNDVLLDHRQHS